VTEGYKGCSIGYCSGVANGCIANLYLGVTMTPTILSVWPLILANIGHNTPSREWRRSPFTRSMSECGGFP
jgi:hypothetical protein